MIELFVKVISLERLCLAVLARVLERADEDESSYNVLTGLPEALARGIFNQMWEFSRSTLRHFSVNSSFLHYLDLSNSRITNEVGREKRDVKVMCEVIDEEQRSSLRCFLVSQRDRE